MLTHSALELLLKTWHISKNTPGCSTPASGASCLLPNPPTQFPCTMTALPWEQLPLQENTVHVVFQVLLAQSHYKNSCLRQWAGQGFPPQVQDTDLEDEKHLWRQGQCSLPCRAWLWKQSTQTLQFYMQSKEYECNTNEKEEAS